MEKARIDIIDHHRSLRQFCLKGLSQFSDDYSLQKVKNLCRTLAPFSFMNFPQDLLNGFENSDSFKQELTATQLEKHTQLTALAFKKQNALGNQLNLNQFKSSMTMSSRSMKQMEISNFESKSIGGDSSSNQSFRDEEIKRDVTAFSVQSGTSQVSI